MGRGRGARPIYAELVSGNYFQVLGVRAILGRTLLPSDEIAPGGHPYAVLNEGFWRLVAAINEDASPRGASRGRMRSALVVAQVAVSLLLLVGAGLPTRSLEAARNVYPGFDPAHVTAVAVDLRANGYNEARGRVFYRQLLDAARAEAGIESATQAANLPLNLIGTREQRVSIDGYTPRRDEDLSYSTNTVGPEYCRTLRITVVAGREFEDRDDDTAAPVAVVNQTLAQKFWGGAANAVGKRLRVGSGGWRTVIGVART